jgi:cell division control protein 12
MSDLISTTKHKHYEDYRLKRLYSMGLTDDATSIAIPTNKQSSMKAEEEELRKKFTEQVRLEEQRFRKWEQNVIQGFTPVDIRTRSIKQRS